MPTHLGNRILPCLQVSDIRRSMEFYTAVLGFTQTGYYPIASEPIRTEVRRDDVAIVLYTDAARGSDGNPSFTGGLYIFPENVDQLAAELKGKVAFIWGPEKTEHGFYEFAIRDPDGYTLVFAQRA
ncbi:MAG: VOC family protein [Pirellulales bacterium]